MPSWLDVTLDLESPLVHESLGADDQAWMPLRISRRTGNHKCNSLNSFTKAHVISKNTSFVATLFLGFHPRQTNRLVLHQVHFERTWSFVLVCLRGLSYVFDAGKQILDILRKVCFLISPMYSRVSGSLHVANREIETYTKSSSSSISCSICSRTKSMALAAASVSPPHGSCIQGRGLPRKGGGPNRGGPPNRGLK